MIRRGLPILLMFLMAGGIVRAENDPNQDTRSDEQKLLDELYAKRIAKARSTVEHDDDLALGRELLMAANDQTHSKKLRELMARSALKLTIELGSDGGVALAKMAVKTIEGLGNLDEVDKARITRDMLSNQFARQVSLKAGRDTLTALAKGCIEAHLDYIRAAASDPDHTDQANASIGKANRLMRAYRLLEYKPVIEKAAEDFRTARALRIELTTARTRLAAAKKQNDPNAVRAARSVLANTYLVYTGDLRRTAKYIKGTGHSREQLVLDVSEAMQDRTKLQPKKAISQISDLLALARTAKDPARAKLAEAAMFMAKLYLASDPPALGKSRAKLLSMQIKKLMGTTESDKVVGKLAKAYDGIAGKVTPLDKGRIRLTYDFTKPDQLKDWSTEEGKWVVTKGVLACDTGSRYRYGGIQNKVKFDSTKPATITFKGTASSQLIAEVKSYRKTSGRRYTDWYFRQDSTSLRSYFMGDSWSTSGDNLIRAGRGYTWKIALDGQGGYAWTINKKLIKKNTEKARAYYLDTNWALSLRAYGSTGRDNITAYDNIVIEGTPVYPSDDDQEDD
jgi:hypothetical protein